MLVLSNACVAGNPCERVPRGGPDDCNGNGIPDDCDLGPHALGFVWRSVHTLIPPPSEHQICSFDMDGDGDGDFVLQSDPRGPVLAFRNRGDETFEEPVSSPVDANAYEVFLLAGADVQGDGIPDLLTRINQTGLAVGVQLGRGEGRFGPRQPFPVPGLTFLAVGDVDGDQRTDAVIGNGMRLTVTVLPGDADTIFGPGRTFPVEIYPYDGELGDLDEDGDLDLVVFHLVPLGSEVSLWENDGTGSFARYGLFYVDARVEPGNVELADFDGDSRLDIAFIGSTREGERVVFIAARDPADLRTFLAAQRAIVSKALLHHLSAVDFDGDGDADLACTDHGRLLLFENLTRLVGGSPSFDFALPGESLDAFPDVPDRVRVVESAVAGSDALLLWVRSVDCADPGKDDIVIVTPRREPRSPDCDGNGVPDVCDADCDRDGIPDACRVPPPLRCASPGAGCTPDCNSNGVGDRCDIAEGASRDAGGDQVPDECQAEQIAFAVEGPTRIRGEPGSQVLVDYTCVLIPGRELLGAEPGVTGWQISLGAEGLEVLSVTTGGTVAADLCDEPGGLRRDGFFFAEPASKPGVRGVVSATVLSLVAPITLPLRRAHRVLRVTLRADLPEEPGVRGARLFYEDGLRGSDSPIANKFVRLGETLRPTLFDLAVELESLPFDFRRGDANVDGDIDITDGVHTLQNLFVGGPRGSCRKAADFNDSGFVDISDPIGTFQTLFLGAPGPPEPGLFECGQDPTPDELSCVEFRPCLDDVR